MIKLISSTFYNEQKTKKALCAFISKAKYLSFGAECLQFEKNFASWQSRKSCLLVTSGSSANLALLQSLINLSRLKIGDKIGFSAVTWSTNVMPIIQLGLIPIPIDISLETLNISSEILTDSIEKTDLKALFLTDLLGFCSDIDKISDICKQNNILLLEDACESLGSEYKGKKLGNFGLASTFSFYVGHQLSTIEGGAIVTDDKELASMLRIVRAHGWDRNLTKYGQRLLRNRHLINSDFYSRYTFYDLGFNMRPTEVVGFLGNLQLSYIDEIIKKREENFIFLAKNIYARAEIFSSVQVDNLSKISNFAFPLVCKTNKLRDAFVQKCIRKIEVRPIVAGNIISQPFYLKYIYHEKNICENAQIIQQNGLYIGNNPSMGKKDLDRIIKIFSN